MTHAHAQPMLGTGLVRHKRLRPRINQFEYRTYFLMLPMRQLRAQPSPQLRRNRWGLISFYDSDHGDGRADCLEWIDSVLAAEGIHDATGEVWLHCYPRVLGYTFKPVSFWYCHRDKASGGGLAAIVVEVNNTFGERHCYLLRGESLSFGRELRAKKVFHVSPFCAVEGQYRFRFMRTESRFDAEPARTVARIDHDDEQGPLIQTSVSGVLTPLTPQAARAAFFGMPLMTLGVMARIHWQALKLFYKRVPFFRKPAAPNQFMTR